MWGAQENVPSSRQTTTDQSLGSQLALCGSSESRWEAAIFNREREGLAVGWGWEWGLGNVAVYNFGHSCAGSWLDLGLERIQHTQDREASPTRAAVPWGGMKKGATFTCLPPCMCRKGTAEQHSGAGTSVLIKGDSGSHLLMGAKTTPLPSKVTVIMILIRFRFIAGGAKAITSLVFNREINTGSNNKQYQPKTLKPGCFQVVLKAILKETITKQNWITNFNPIKPVNILPSIKTMPVLSSGIPHLLLWGSW